MRIRKQVLLATVFTASLAFFPVMSAPPARAAESPVATAAAGGDIERVRALLRAGADVNASQGDGMTALHWAAKAGDAALAETLLYAGARVDVGTRIGRYTPLHMASREGRAAVVETLLDAGANPLAATTNSGAQAIHLAAAAGDANAIRALIKAGADPNARESSWGQTPLIFAAAYNRVEAIDALLRAGADPSLAAWSVDTAEMERADRAAEKRLNEILAEMKKYEGGDASWRPRPSQVQAAIEAAREIQRKWPNVPDAEEKEDKEKAEGEDGDKKEMSAPAQAPSSAAVSYDADGNPTHEEAESGEGEQKRLSYGAHVGGWGGLAPLHHAVRQGHKEAVLRLLDAGADIDQRTGGDQTSPLLMAALNGQFDLALVLLERGADPNLASHAGATPLFAALERQWAPRASYAHPIEHEQQQTSHHDLMRALLDAGADPNARLNMDLWYTEYTFSVLRAAGLHLAGATPFWRAAHALDVEAMRMLKEAGAETNTPTIKLPERRRPMPMEAPEEDKAGIAATAAAGEGGEGGEDEKDAEAPLLSNDDSLLIGAAAGDDYTGVEGDEEDHSGVPPVAVGGPFIYPIHVAAGAGYGQYFASNAHRHAPDKWLEAVKFLVEECGADVNLRDANAYTPLHHAASRGDNEMIEYLISKGADVMAVSRKGQTTVDMANGPIQRVQPFPETIALLESFGAKNNDNCMSC